MKTWVLLLAGWCAAGATSAQNLASFYVPDTLLVETFELDPTGTMGQFPTGGDLTWVNFDLDGFPGQCVDDGSQTPNGWYWESDLGDPGGTSNSCYTSCSFFDNDPGANYPCANWLILPPVYIPDSTYQLSWKSLSFQGPAFLDGYRVLVSTTTNDPFDGVFTDTLFAAAEMLSCLGNCNTLNLADYSFSPGYIHADSFSNPDYFFLDGPPGAKFYHGRLEPHSINLAAYQGQTIYIAFLHDSNNDYLLQLDDIVVADDATSALRPDPAGVRYFTVQPTLVHDAARVQWAFENAQRGQLQMHDVSGRPLRSWTLESAETAQQNIDFQDFPAGLYFLTLQTASGQTATRRVAKVN